MLHALILAAASFTLTIQGETANHSQYLSSDLGGCSLLRIRITLVTSCHQGTGSADSGHWGGGVITAENFSAVFSLDYKNFLAVITPSPSTVAACSDQVILLRNSQQWWTLTLRNSQWRSFLPPRMCEYWSALPLSAILWWTEMKLSQLKWWSFDGICSTRLCSKFCFLDFVFNENFVSVWHNRRNTSLFLCWAMEIPVFRVWKNRTHRVWHMNTVDSAYRGQLSTVDS